MSNYYGMHNEPITWKQVDEIAAELGAPVTARQKWRQRDTGVPQAWRIRIAQASDIPFSAFDELPRTPGRIAA